MKNPAAHVYLLFAPFMLGGPLLVKQEWLLGFVTIGIATLLVYFVKYYAPIKNNKTIIQSLTIFTIVCATTGTLEALGLISFGANYSIFLIALAYTMFKLKNVVTTLADEKAKNDT